MLYIRGCKQLGPQLDPRIGFGIFVLGAAVGAILTAIRYSGQFRNLKNQGGPTELRVPHPKDKNENDFHDGAA